MLKVVASESTTQQDFISIHDEIAREGTRRMLIEALRIEADEYIQRHSSIRDENGRKLVVPNGTT